MGQREERAVREFVREWEGDELDDARIERILDLMSPDAQYQVYAWERPLTGRDEIRDELRRQAPWFRNFSCDLKAVASTDQTVLIERVDSQTVGKEQRLLRLHTAGVFTVDAEGKITAWRDYYDSKEIEAQLGRGWSTAGSRA
jgi:limonene-1,2-epoxide hydrolase